MAAIYTTDSETITGGLQGSNTSDHAYKLACTVAAERGEAVVLEDDDGTWIVQPDGTCTEAD